METKKRQNLVERLAQYNLRPEQARKFIAAKSAADARAIWDYRAANLAIDEARKTIDYVRDYRGASRYPQSADTQRTERITAYYHRQYTRNAAREQLDLVTIAKKYTDIDNYLRGYGHGYNLRLPLTAGRTLLLRRCESVDWGSRKNPRWPESKTTTYHATLYNAKYDIIATCNFDRRGDWQGRVADGLGLAISARTAITLSGANQIISSRTIAGITVTVLAPFGGTVRLYCVSRGTITYHADTVSAAIAGLRKKIDAEKPIIEREIITVDDCVDEMGFCRAGVSQFIRDCNLPEDTDELRRDELQKIVAAHDCTIYRNELSQLGIEVA